MAETLGLSFKEIQKYERGFNRVIAATLYNMAVSKGGHSLIL
jgi:hypothetical protein